MEMSFKDKVRSSPAAAVQRGAVLAVSLLMLLIMTVLALGASQVTRTQERLAATVRDRDVAFQAAEAGLRAGERLIDDPDLTSIPYPCTSGRCRVYERNAIDIGIALQPADWWDNNAWSYAVANLWKATPGSAISGTGSTNREPQFFIEEYQEVTDSLTISPTGAPSSRMYYRVTSAGKGSSATPQVVLQSTFARRFN